jgi:predicted acetyltransferase
VLRLLTLADADVFERARVRAAADTTSDTIFAMRHEEGMAFEAYVQRLDDDRRGISLPDGFVPSTLLFAFAGGEIVGRVSIRHTLNDFLRTVGGHIGYMVIADSRRRGHGTTILREALVHARALGITDALLTCDEDNVASRRMIEHAGGRYEGTGTSADGSLRKRRYFIATQA